MTDKEKDDTALEPTTKAPMDASAKSAIVSAIHNLDRNDPKHYNKRGEPRVEALTEMCGFKVTRAEVVEVWGAEGEPDTGERVPSPVECLRLFERAMVGSRNSVLNQLLNHWQRDSKAALELAERLEQRGQY